MPLPTGRRSGCRRRPRVRGQGDQSGSIVDPRLTAIARPGRLGDGRQVETSTPMPAAVKADSPIRELGAVRVPAGRADQVTGEADGVGDRGARTSSGRTYHRRLVVADHQRSQSSPGLTFRLAEHRVVEARGQHPAPGQAPPWRGVDRRNWSGTSNATRRCRPTARAEGGTAQGVGAGRTCVVDGPEPDHDGGPLPVVEGGWRWCPRHRRSPPAPGPPCAGRAPCSMVAVGGDRHRSPRRGWTWRP